MRVDFVLISYYYLSYLQHDKATMQRRKKQILINDSPKLKFVVGTLFFVGLSAINHRKMRCIYNYLNDFSHRMFFNRKTHAEKIVTCGPHRSTNRGKQLNEGILLFNKIERLNSQAPCYASKQERT
jgi:hypothetical protein